MNVKINCYLFEGNNQRRKYVIDIYDEITQITHGYGHLITEKYDGVWNIELMYVMPQRKGYGTMLLNYALNDLKEITNKVVVNPISEEGQNFFKKNGFDIEYT